MKINPNENNDYPLYLWDKSQLYRGCILVAEQFEGQFYAHYFDWFGDFAILPDSPCATIAEALDIARMTVDEHIYQAIKDGQDLPILNAFFSLLPPQS